MLVPTDLVISVTRTPIALKASYPELAKAGWALLSFTIAQSLVNPFIDISKGPKQQFGELYSLAKSGYAGMKADLGARLDLVPLPELEEQKMAYQTARRIIDTPFIYSATLNPIDPNWIAAMISLEELVTLFEQQMLPAPELA